MQTALTYAIAFVALLNTAASPLILNDPRGNETRARRVWGGYAIPLARGEKMVFYDREYERAKALVVLWRSPYERARSETRLVVAERIGIAAEGEVGEKDEGIFPEKEVAYRGQVRELLFGKRFVRFSALGVDVDRLREYQIRSRRYNAVKELSGSSELRLRMTDGRALFGTESTLVVVSRIDYTRQRSRYYDIPLPFKESMNEELVTDTEVGLVQDVAARLGGVKEQLFVPYPGYKLEPYWMDFMTAIRDAARKL